MTLHFILPGRPVGKQRARRGAGGHWYTPAPTRRYEAALLASALAVRGASTTTITGPCTVEVVYCRGDNRRADGDNVLKAAQDSLRGVIYHDDSQVTKAVVERMEDGHPRTEVTVRW